MSDARLTEGLGDSSRRTLAVALVHHPVLDAQGQTVTSALTNIDVHDLARSARTYGCAAFYVVHPIEAQRTLVTRIVEHWTHGSSAQRIPDRKEALSIVRPVASLADAVSDLAGPRPVETWVTAARRVGESTSFAQARAELAREGAGPVLVVFGTAWGLADEVVSGADRVLEPIVGRGDWNHLSVRAACAIALDRLAGR